VAWGIDESIAGQGDPARDETPTKRQSMPCASPPGGDHAPIVDLGEALARVVAAALSPPPPTAPGERPARSGQLGPVDDLGCAERGQVRGLRLASSARGHDLVARTREEYSAMPPTPPAAPVTSTSPFSGVSPWRSSARTASMTV